MTLCYSVSVLHRRWTVPLALILPLAALGCSGSETAEADRTGPTVGTDAPTTTEPADPFAVPEEIDAAYVERVSNELLRVLGDADRIAQKEGSATPEVVERYEDVYDPTVAHEWVEDVTDQAAQGFPGVENPSGDTTVSTSNVREATDTCIIAEAEFDFRGSTIEDRAPEPGVIVLWKDEGPPRQFNPTPWSLRAMSAIDQHSDEMNSCSAQSQ